MKKIIVIGQVCEDILMHKPKSIDILGEKIWAKDIVITMGGSASYVSTALCHLGEKVELYATVGMDHISDRVLKIITNFGVDCSKVLKISNSSTTSSMIICNEGEKKFLGCSPMLPMIIPKKESLKNCSMIFIAGYMLYPELWSEEAFEFFYLAHKQGIPIIIDGQFLPVGNKDLLKLTSINRLLSICDTLLIARKEAMQFGVINNGKLNYKNLFDIGLNTLILKEGAQGCRVINANEVTKVEGYPVDVYDTVGSGDLFGAGFCYGKINGWNDVESSRFANVFSALSLKEYEDYKKYPSIKQVKDLI